MNMLRICEDDFCLKVKNIIIETKKQRSYKKACLK